MTHKLKISSKPKNTAIVSKPSAHQVPGIRMRVHGPSISERCRCTHHSFDPQHLYVQALYDYNANDMTQLSFHKGDIIHVISRSWSGWWDGQHNGKRGWFPSSYCEVPGAQLNVGGAVRIVVGDSALRAIVSSDPCSPLLIKPDTEQLQ